MNLAKNYVTYGKGFIKFIKSLIVEPSLNLGCGAFKIGTVNVDIDKSCNPDIVFDLENFPYPFEDGSFRTLIMLDVLEHLRDVDKVISECYRILDDRGRIIIAVPHPNSRYYRIDGHVNFFTKKILAQHLTGFDVKFLNYLGNTKDIPVFISLLLGKIVPNKIVCIAEKVRIFTK